MSNEIQTKLTELKLKGWTLANIARAIGQAKGTIEAWNQGKRSPANLQSVLASLDKLGNKQAPKKKLYPKGSRIKGKNKPKSHENEISNQPPIDKEHG